MSRAVVRSHVAWGLASLGALIFGFAALDDGTPPAPDADEVEVKAVLASYKSALERRDLAGTEALFADDNVVAESGKLEGSYRDYVAHHIGPELGHFTRFAFSDYTVRVECVGDVAWATETYRYVIELNDRAAPIERHGLSTTVLQRLDGAWKIRSMHSSSRAPKPPAPTP